MHGLGAGLPRHKIFFYLDLDVFNRCHRWATIRQPSHGKGTNTELNGAPSALRDGPPNRGSLGNLPPLASRHYAGAARSDRGDELCPNFLEKCIRKLSVGDRCGVCGPQVGPQPQEPVLFAQHRPGTLVTQPQAALGGGRRISTARSVFLLDGGACVTGSTVTHCLPASSAVTRTTAQGRSLTPSSCPRVFLPPEIAVAD